MSVNKNTDTPTSAVPRDPETNLLRIISDDYDQAQRARVAKGEQIRAIVQGRDKAENNTYLSSLGFLPVVRDGKEIKTAADILLESILKNLTDEPHSYLSSSYRLDWQRERLSYSRMSEILSSHPAWPWMSQVRGVGPTLGAKLLSRLDIERAKNSSSFWSYCGLSTVPGQRWVCPICSWVGIFPLAYEVTGKHKGCSQTAIRQEDNNDIRAAMPKAAKGQKRPYDSFAKWTMFLLASSWLKSGPKSYYNQAYRDKISFYDRERPGWEKGRKHYSALRTIEKLFLSHLFEAWSKSIGREMVNGLCYAEVVLGHIDIISAEEVLLWERTMSGKSGA